MRFPFVFIIVVIAALKLHAQEGLDAGLMRMPAVSEKHIAFVYAGDIWIASREGGTAFRLSSPQGEELFPHSAAWARCLNSDLCTVSLRA